MPRWCLATSVEEAVECGGRMDGRRLAVKAVGGRIIHKTDVGGVILDVVGTEGVVSAFRELESRLGGLMEAALVQEMVPRGIEAIIGARRDQGFGGTALVGLGGVIVEVVRDYRITLAPVDSCRAMEAVRGLKGYRLLEGYRGIEANPQRLAEALERASLLMVHPRVREVDLNPVILHGDTASVVDARIILD